MLCLLAIELTAEAALPVALKAPISEGVREAPDWVPDSSCQYCCLCNSEFTFANRRVRIPRYHPCVTSNPILAGRMIQHHCRGCGLIFCGSCSSYKSALPEFGIKKKSRVCRTCYNFHQHKEGTQTVRLTGDRATKLLSTRFPLSPDASPSVASSAVATKTE